jgi:hypothetical protein
VCDLETSRMGAPYIYDISKLRVKMQHRWNDNDSEKPNHSKKLQSQCYFAQNKSHNDWPGIESGPPGWGVDDQLHEPWLGH